MALHIPLRSRLLESRLCKSCQQHFAFSTSAPSQKQKHSHRKSVKEQALDESVGSQRVYDAKGRRQGTVYPDILPYPYGPRLWYKQANRGLYGGLSIRAGNNVSEKNKIKTRTTWKPNIQSKSLYSQALGRAIKVRVAARVLRTIDKVGGLDEYLLGDKPARIKELGPTGWMLRWRLLRTESVQERFRQQRIAMGLPEEGIGELGLIDLLGKPATLEQVQKQVEEVDAQLDEAEMFEDDDPEASIDITGNHDVQSKLDQPTEPAQPSFMAEEFPANTGEGESEQRSWKSKLLGRKKGTEQ